MCRSGQTNGWHVVTGHAAAGQPGRGVGRNGGCSTIALQPLFARLFAHVPGMPSLRHGGEGAIAPRWKLDVTKLTGMCGSDTLAMASRRRMGPYEVIRAVFSLHLQQKELFSIAESAASVGQTTHTCQFCYIQFFARGTACRSRHGVPNKALASVLRHLAAHPLVTRTFPRSGSSTLLVSDMS